MMAAMMFGDIGFAAAIGAWAALLSGIGFWGGIAIALALSPALYVANEQGPHATVEEA